jgi:hypothetical protein
MTAVEQSRRRIVQPWQKFVDGTPYPKFCWSSPFIKAFTQKFQSGSLLVVAAGELEQDIAHEVYGEMSPQALVRSLHQATNGINRLRDEDAEIFTEGYEGIINSAGRNNVDVLVMTVEGDRHEEVSMAHFGSRAIHELAPQLGTLTTKLTNQSLLMR